MVLAFGGWSDAGEASSGVINHLLASLPIANPDSGGATLIAESNSEDFYDFQVNRPLAYLTTEGSRSLTWPGVQVFGVRNPSSDSDFVLVRGVEPSMKWRAFVDEILDLAEDLEVELILTVGAMLADTPHTRAIPVSTTAVKLDIAEKYGVEVSRYEGPTGILSVLLDHATRRGIDALSIWAAIPHYAHLAPSPKATLALINAIEDLTESSLPIDELAEGSVQWEQNVSEMVKEDSDVEEYIKSLEESKDADQMRDDSGEELAKEVERFLRRQNKAED